MIEETNAAGTDDWEKLTKGQKIVILEPQALTGERVYASWDNKESAAGVEGERKGHPHGLSAIAAKARNLGGPDLSKTFRDRKR